MFASAQRVQQAEAGGRDGHKQDTRASAGGRRRARAAVQGGSPARRRWQLPRATQLPNCRGTPSGRESAPGPGPWSACGGVAPIMLRAGHPPNGRGALVEPPTPALSISRFCVLQQQQEWRASAAMSASGGERWWGERPIGAPAQGAQPCTARAGCSHRGGGTGRAREGQGKEVSWGCGKACAAGSWPPGWTAHA